MYALRDSYLEHRDKFPRIHGFVARSIYAKCASLWPQDDDTGISEALSALDCLFSRWAYPEYFEDEDSDATAKDRSPDEDCDDIINSHVARLFYLRDSEEVRKHLSVSGALDASWFAALGLGHLAASIGALERAAGRSDDPYFPSRLSESSEALALAMEALGYAERLSFSESELTERLRVEISTRNAKAGKQRHAKIEGLKEQYRAYYGAHGDLSKAEAARRFLASLPEHESRLLSPSNAERTLVQSLKA